MSVFFARNSTRADLSLGRWPATITCFFSGRTAYSVPSLAFRRAGLPSCASQQKSDGHQLPYRGPLPEHGTTLNYFASKKITRYAAFGSRRGITLSFFTPITSYLVHIQLLYGMLYTTTSRPNTNTSTITLYVNSRASFHFGQHVIYRTLK